MAMITLADALASPPMAAAHPAIRTRISGTASRNVRWVHSSEVLEIAALLRGGELLLTGGSALLALDHGQQRDFIERLAARGVSALCIEAPESGLPDAAIEVANDVGLPVIELRRVVRFVDVTEEINRLIVDSRARVHLTVDRLSQRIAQQIIHSGSSIPDILHLVASELIANVRLVAADGEVLGDAGVLEGDDDMRPATDESKKIREVAADIVLDGQLVAQLLLRSDETPSDHLSVAAERLREMLALALAHRHHGSLGQVLHGNLIAAVIDGQDPHLIRRLWHQAGLEPDAAAVVLVVSGFGRGADGINLLRSLRAQNRRVMVHQQDARMTVLAPLSAADLDQRAGLVRVASGAMSGTPLFGVAGPLVWDNALAHLSFTEAERILRHHPPRPGSLGDSMADFSRRAMETLSADTVTETYSRALLGDILYWDRMKGTDLAATLLAWLDNGCRTTATAPTLHIERQTLHKRLQKIHELLGGDPRSDGRSFDLHLALRFLASLESKT